MHPKRRSGAALLYVLMLLFVVTLVMSGLVLWAAQARKAEDLAYRQLRLHTLMAGAEAFAPTLLNDVLQLSNGEEATLFDGPFGEGELQVQLEHRRGPEYRLRLDLRLGKDRKSSTMRLWGLAAPKGISVSQPVSALEIRQGKASDAIKGKLPALLFSETAIRLGNGPYDGASLQIDAPEVCCASAITLKGRLVVRGDLTLTAPLKAKELVLDGALHIEDGGLVEAERLIFSQKAASALPDPIPETLHGERQTLAEDNRIWYYVLDYALEREIP